MSVVDKIQHYQRNIEKCCEDEDRLLYCISKLYNLPVTVQHLQETGVGRTVNALRKYDGGVGDAAKALVAKWKAMVADEETTDGDDEDEACVPDAPESYSDSPESPKIIEDRIPNNSIKSSRHKHDDSKHKHRHKTEKIEEPAYDLKHSSKEETKFNPSENHSSIDKITKGGIDRQGKNEKNKQSSKHESRTEKRSSSKDLKNSHSSKKDDVHTSKKVCDKPSSSYKSSKAIYITEESYKKQKLDIDISGKNKIKKEKHSECESDEETTRVLSGTEKITVSDISESEKKSVDFKIKQESQSYYSEGKNMSNKNDFKSEKKKSYEKSKNSFNKLGASDSKVKDNEEKDKNKRELEENERKQKKNHSTHHSNKESSKSKNHSSSSSNKSQSKNKDRDKKKDSEEEKIKSRSRDNDKLRNSKNNFKESKEKVKIKHEINGDEGIDCNSGASFAEALGMCTVTPLSRKRSNNSPSSGSAKVLKTDLNASSIVINKKVSSIKSDQPSSDNSDPLSLLAPNAKLEPLSVDLASTLPEISPNYKPLPYFNPVMRKEEDKALTDVIYVKNQRTKVYSGNKTGYTSVPTLYDMCIRVLIENIDALEFTGGVPYDIIKPVLERATPDQLFMLEHYNPYLVEDTDALWQFHCSREFRNKQRGEMETWREMYMRCLDEREAKLKTLTANIKQSIDKTVPLRSTKLAYVDNVVKPPRNVLRKQAKYGTANSTPTSTSNLKKKLIGSGSQASATNISVPPPPMSRMKTSSGVIKKTKAPLMAKALQLIKGRYKR